MEQTKPITAFGTMRIPPASPYYDRLRSLNIQMDFVPYGSPEYHFLNRQIEELEKRARKHMETNRNIAFYHYDEKQ